MLYMLAFSEPESYCLQGADQAFIHVNIGAGFSEKGADQAFIHVTHTSLSRQLERRDPLSPCPATASGGTACNTLSHLSRQLQGRDHPLSPIPPSPRAGHLCTPPPLS